MSTAGSTLYLAPMAGLTHAPFRRLVASLGGCDVFTTEMLSARHLMKEDLERSPYVRRGGSEPRLIHQVMLTDRDPIEEVAVRLGGIGSDGLDLNLACHAPLIRSARAGSALYLDREALVQVLERLRAAWTGPLTVKIRLGQDKPGWEATLRDRLALFEATGVDGVAVHARFFEDKYKRRVKQELFPRIRAWTSLPLVASGELHEADGAPLKAAAELDGYSGWMVGRMAVVRPWLFRTWRGGEATDPAEVWNAVTEGLLDAFPEPGARGRLKQFTLYLSRNYLFGHRFAMAIRAAGSVEEMRAIAGAFFDRNPDRIVTPNLAGLA